MDELFSLGGRRPLVGCALLALHWTILVITGFVVTLVTIPILVVVASGVSTVTGISLALDPEIAIFGVFVPIITVLSLWASRRINRWIDARLHLPAQAAPAPADDLLARVAELDAGLARPAEPGSGPAGQ